MSQPTIGLIERFNKAKAKDTTIAFLKRLEEEELEALIREANRLYRHGEELLMTDSEYDYAVELLTGINSENSFLSESIYGDTQAQEYLPYWMPSLDKVKDEDALQKWLDAHEGKIVVMPKLDGVSGLYTREVGSDDARLNTKGKQGKGENVSRLLQRIHFPSLSGKKKVAVRGEFIIPKRRYKEFAINKTKDSRSVVAGLINRRDSKPDTIRLQSRLSFVTYEHVYPKTNMSAGLEKLANLGFDVVTHRVYNSAKLSFARLQKMLALWRDESEYQMDGLVLFHDEPYQLEWGEKYPSYAIAFKDPEQMERDTTTVTAVQWVASKDRYLKPVVIYEPVILGACTYTEATGKNARFVDKHGIGPGAKIQVVRGGGVIPDVEKVLKPSPNGPSFPDTKYEWIESGAEIRATEDNDESLTSLIIHFAKIMGIDGLKRGRASKIVNGGLVKSISDLWYLSSDQLCELEGFGETSAETLVESIEAAKRRCLNDLPILMAASNIFDRGLGETVLRAIYEGPIGTKLSTNKKAQSITVEEVIESGTEGVGEKRARQFVRGIPAFLNFLSEVRLNLKEFASPVPMPLREEDQAEAKGSTAPEAQSLEGEVIVFTGFRDKDGVLKKLIAKKGGRLTSSISGKTTLVVAADLSTGQQKLNKAKADGIKVMSRDEFEKMLDSD